jgi:hypothetical protein
MKMCLLPPTRSFSERPCEGYAKRAAIPRKSLRSGPVSTATMSVASNAANGISASKTSLNLPRLCRSRAVISSSFFHKWMSTNMQAWKDRRRFKTRNERLPTRASGSDLLTFER